MQSLSDSGAKDQAADRPLIAEFRAATKRYGTVLAADALSFGIGKGEFLSFLGPSGCGKTTALRMLAGFETPTSGEVYLDGERVTDVPAYRRPVNMVFQHYALFPHMTVAENISYGLMQRRPRADRADVARKVDRALDMVRLSGFGPRRIWEMSGGQQQRVALARAIVNEPKVLLLDEPLAALDRKLRREMQIELKTMQQDLGITFVFVTHDQSEALSMADSLAVFNNGRIAQIGTPSDIYAHPKTRFVADFVGSSNVLPPAMTQTLGGPAKWSSLRPEALRPAPFGPITGTVTALRYLGAGNRVTVSTQGQDIAALLPIGTPAPDIGDALTLTFDPAALHVMDDA